MIVELREDISIFFQKDTRFEPEDALARAGYEYIIPSEGVRW